MPLQNVGDHCPSQLLRPFTAPNNACPFTILPSPYSAIHVHKLFRKGFTSVPLVFNMFSECQVLQTPFPHCIPEIKMSFSLNQMTTSFCLVLHPDLHHLPSPTIFVSTLPPHILLTFLQSYSLFRYYFVFPLSLSCYIFSDILFSTHLPSTVYSLLSYHLSLFSISSIPSLLTYFSLLSYCLLLFSISPHLLPCTPSYSTVC